MENGILGFQPPLHHHSSSSSSHSTHQNLQPVISYITPMTLNHTKDDLELNNGDIHEHDHKKRNKNNTNSMWHRMKWTDSMVKLLLTAVCYIRDNSAVTVTEVLRKKRKWKSVSKAMMERGFLVSPQQCEDKFSDLNKGYKRLNDILGKENALRSVDDQSSLEKIDHLSPETKEEVKKLLNSKNFFFREMHSCHNGCGNMNSAVLEPILERRRREDNDGNEDEELEEWSRKRARLMEEMVGMIQNEKKSLWEKREWMKGKLMKLEEDRVGFLEEGLKLEMGRMKWMNCIRKKEMEIEEERMEKKKLMIENDRMILLVLRKEVELAIQQH